MTFAGRTLWRGRQGLRIANDRIGLTVLARGGAIAEFGWIDATGAVVENALWESPWLGQEELPQSDEAIERAYGDLGVGRYLNRYTGHMLCLDGFGPATSREVQAGAALHGEAAVTDWEFDDATTRAHLPLAQITIERSFCIQTGETVARVEERVSNSGPRTRALHWVQHVTVGPPMFDEKTIVSASVSEGLTWPFVYEGVPLLEVNALFRWPHAPKEDGETLDLSRLFAIRNTGFVAATRQQRGRKFGFLAAFHPEQQTALVYVFPAGIFPWVAFWEENRCRTEWPWNGRTQARGLEFGTTPLPLGNAHVDATGPVLDTPVSLLLSARTTVCVPWVMAIAQVPKGWSRIDDVTVQKDALLVHAGGETVAIEAGNVEAFLERAGELR
jgi:hypothetical protein